MTTQTQSDIGNDLDKRLIDQCDLSVRHRRSIELRIARKTIRVLQNAGLEIHADNGEDQTKWNANEDELIENLFACDEGHLITLDKNGYKSFVFFVLGNDGYDVINDYGSRLDPLIDFVHYEFADKLEASGS